MGNVYVANDPLHPVPVTGGITVAGAALSPVYYSAHITTNTTTTVTSATCYMSALAVSVTVIGTTEVLKIQNKEGTPKIIYQQGSPLVLGTVTPINLTTPIPMTSGIDIVTSGAGAATLDVFITYWQ